MTAVSCGRDAVVESARAADGPTPRMTNVYATAAIHPTATTSGNDQSRITAIAPRLRGRSPTRLLRMLRSIVALLRPRRLGSVAALVGCRRNQRDTAARFAERFLLLWYGFRYLRYESTPWTRL